MKKLRKDRYYTVGQLVMVRETTMHFEIELKKKYYIKKKIKKKRNKLNRVCRRKW